MQNSQNGGTGWRRTGLLLIPGLLGVLFLVGLTLRGVLPLNLTITGQDFKIHAENVHARQGVTAYPSSILMKGGDEAPVILAALPEAYLDDGLCASLRLTFPVVGTYIIKFRVTGELRATDITAAATFADAHGITIGELEGPAVVNSDASAVTGMTPGPAGAFSVQVPNSALDIKSANATAAGAIVSGTVKISGLDFPSISHGDHPGSECY